MIEVERLTLNNSLAPAAIVVCNSINATTPRRTSTRSAPLARSTHTHTHALIHTHSLTHTHTQVLQKSIDGDLGRSVGRPGVATRPATPTAVVDWPRIEWCDWPARFHRSSSWFEVGTGYGGTAGGVLTWSANPVSKTNRYNRRAGSHSLRNLLSSNEVFQEIYWYYWFASIPALHRVCSFSGFAGCAGFFYGILSSFTQFWLVFIRSWLLRSYRVCPALPEASYYWLHWVVLCWFPSFCFTGVSSGFSLDCVELQRDWLRLSAGRSSCRESGSVTW